MNDYALIQFVEWAGWLELKRHMDLQVKYLEICDAATWIVNCRHVMAQLAE
jgi:hypothetical protein